MSLYLQVKWCFGLNAKVVIASMLPMTAGGNIFIKLDPLVNIFNEKLKFDYYPESAASLCFMELDSEIKLIVSQSGLQVYSFGSLTALRCHCQAQQAADFRVKALTIHCSSTANSRQKWSRLARAHKRAFSS